VCIRPTGAVNFVPRVFVLDWDLGYLKALYQLCNQSAINYPEVSTLQLKQSYFRNKSTWILIQRTASSMKQGSRAVTRQTQMCTNNNSEMLPIVSFYNSRQPSSEIVTDCIANLVLPDMQS
jgi:hypothetical protein